MIRGIDISRNNGVVNIQALPSDIAFVSLKLGQGATEQDPDFQNWYHELRNSRPEITRIPYFFFDPRIDGVIQAKNALSMMVDIEGDDGGPMDQWSAANFAQFIKHITDFIAYVKANSGRQELFFYTFDSYIHNVLKNHLFPDTMLWIASYQTNPPPVLPGWPYQLWQYAQYGRPDGTSGSSAAYGSYDLDRFMGTQAQLDALANR
jgi:GH25 family lysozyme M1 (1,4-beta-N-acetylmuramidase)